jgi:flagellar protein FliO/FliZ
LPKFALLFVVGLLILIPSIFSQESAQEDPFVFEQAVDPLRAAELAMTFEEETVGVTTVAGPSVWAVVRMLLVLALAAAAIYGVVFFLKRSSKQALSNDPFLNNPFLKVLANARLVSNCYVHVVSVGNKTWLIGSSAGGVNLIGEVDDTDTINAMLLEDSNKTVAAPGRFPDFLSMLRRLGAPAGTAPVGIDEIRKHRDRLKGL